MLITRKMEFSASHVCRVEGRSDQENQQLYGPAANPHGHGHNYVLEVTLEGQPDPVTGMIVDLKLVKDVIQREVIDDLDHRFLNREVTPFQTVVPTTENIAIEIWRRLQPSFDQAHCRLQQVRLYETEDLYVEYTGS